MEWSPALGRQLLIDLGDQLFDPARLGIATQLGLNASGMHGSSAHAPFPMPLVESHGKQDIRRLRPAVSYKGLIGRALEVRVIEIDVRVAVPCGREVDETPTSTDQRSDPVDEDKVSQVIGAELGFKSVSRMSKWSGHHAGIGDDNIEGVTFGEQPVGGGAHTGETGEIEGNKLEASTTFSGILAHLSGCRFRLVQISRRTNYMGAMGGERTRRFHAEPGRDSGYENPLAVQVDTGQNVFCC